MFRPVDPTSDRPLYRQIAASIRAAITEGKLERGASLPSEPRLMDTFRASRGTVRQAIALLKAEGLVVVEQGRGAFVPERPPVRRLAHNRFARKHRDAGKAAFIVEMEAEGREPAVDVLEVGPKPVSAEIAARLEVSEGDEVLARRRIYRADGWALEIATSYVPMDIAEGTAIAEHDSGPGGIYARLEELGHRLKRFTEEISARMPLAEEARALGLASGVPVFRLIRTAYDARDRPVEVCDTIMATDRYLLTYELPAE